MALNDDLNEAKDSLREITDAANRLADNFGSISATLKDGFKGADADVKNLAKRSKLLTDNLTESATQLAKEAAKGSKDLKNISKQVSSARARQLTLQSQIRVVQERLVNATEEEQEALIGVLETLVNAETSASELVRNFDRLSESAQELDQHGKYFDTMGNALKSIPVIGPLLASSLFEARNEIQEIESSSDGTNKNLRKANAIAKPLGSAALVAVATSLISGNNSSFNLAKNLSISVDEARALRSEFNTIAIDSGVSALNANAMAESMIQLGDTIGATAGFTTQQVVDQTKLTRMVGLQAEEAAKLAEFGTLNGEETRSLTEDILEQSAILEKETGIRLDNRKVLSQVANITGQLGAQYGYNTKELARAVVQANRLGLSLEETQGVAANLLDFEQSITNELQAELLIGRDLNLEQARLLALQGDSAGAAAEMAKQFGTAEEFSRLNVIQQQSLAAAVGMSADQLADIIKKQEVLNTLGEKNFDTLMQTEEGRQRISELGGKQLLQQLEQQSAAQKFQQALEKIQSAIGAIVDGPIGHLIDGVADLASNAFAVKTALGLIAGLSLVRVIGSITSMVASLVAVVPAAAGIASALTFGLSAVAVAAGIGLIMASISKAKKGAEMMPMNDGIIPPGYGDRIISTPKGQIALNNQDTIVAGTNLGQGSNNQETKRTNTLLEKLIQQNSDKPRLSPIGLYEVQ